MNDCILAVNGERRDQVNGMTHLGNGYRAYNPEQMRFNCPDNLSPFGAGGINPYAYCAGDPVNRTDPSGHFSLGQEIGLALGFVAGIALSILTEGAAMPAVVSLVATMAGDAAIGAGAELATEAIDRQRINWRQVGMAAGLSAAANVIGFGMGKASKLKGLSNQPFSGLMMEGAGASGIRATGSDIAASRISILPQEGVHVLGITTRPNSHGNITRELALAYRGIQNNPEHLDILINMSNRTDRSSHVNINGVTWEGKRLFKEIRKISGMSNIRSFRLLGRNTQAAAQSFMRGARQQVTGFYDGGFYIHASNRYLYSNILREGINVFDNALPDDAINITNQFLNERLAEISNPNMRTIEIRGINDRDVSTIYP